MRHPASCEPLESRLFLTTTPNDPRYAQEWGLSAVAAGSAWDTTTGASSVVVAGIDTGIDYTHDDLYLNMWVNQSEIPTALKTLLVDADRDGAITFYDLNAKANRGYVTDVDDNGRIDAADLLTRAKYGGWADGRDGDRKANRNGYADDIIGWDFANNDRNPMDADGHGTHTAGTIAATGNNATGVTGVAWRASLMAVKIFDDQGYSADDAAIAAAIRYSAANGARVSNNSWGGGEPSQAIYDAIAYAGTKGQLFVVAAGNDSANLDSRFYNDYPAEFDLDNVIVVGATASGGSAAYFSNYGASNVDVFAPGSSILSTYPGDAYATMSGTSMAAPHVAGAAALMLAADDALSAAQTKTRIVAGADQSAALSGLSVSGGELNVANALAAATGARYTGSSSSETPVLPGRGRLRRFALPAEAATASPPTTNAGAPVTATAAPRTAAVRPTARELTESATAGEIQTLPPRATASTPFALFSTRAVTLRTAGYEPSRATGALLAFNDTGARAPVAGLHDHAAPPTPARISDPFADAAPPATELMQAPPPALPADSLFALASVATSADASARWSFAGLPARVTALLATAAALGLGGYAYVRRKRATLQPAADLADDRDTADPIEFMLRHNDVPGSREPVPPVEANHI